MVETLTTPLPASIEDRHVHIELAAIRPAVLSQCLLLGLRVRTFPYMYEVPREGRDEGEFVASAIASAVEEVRQGEDGVLTPDLTIELPRFIEATAIHPESDPIEPLDLADVSAQARLALIIEGIRCFPAKQLPYRLLADPLVLPGDEPDHSPR